MSAAADVSFGGLRVDAAEVSVEPGAVAATSIGVRSSVDAPLDVMVDVVGPYASWCTVTPPRLRLAAHGHAKITGHVRMPTHPPSGPAPVVIGIRARAVGSDVAPHVGELRVVPLVTVDVGVDLAPPIQRVSGAARFVAVVRNNGHTPVRVRLQPGELGDGARMRIRPHVVDVAPRGRARSKVAVRAPAPWIGAEPEHRLTVRASVGERQIHAPASFVQRTRAGTALLVLAGALLLLALVLAALLFRGDVTAPTGAPAASLLIVQPMTRKVRRKLRRRSCSSLHSIMADEAGSTRVDRWLWSIRIYKTRADATSACRGGHVVVNGRAAKPATPVRVGDRVEAHVNRRDRVIEVTRIIDKRVGAPLAAQCYIDHSPPPPEREQAWVPMRDRGAGRPTKRERRQLEQWRGRR